MKASSPAYLLDVNFLVALAHPIHEHHALCRKWIRANASKGWALCPITENGMLRVICGIAMGESRYDLHEGVAYLERLRQLPECSFVTDSVTIAAPSSSIRRASGHQQITDAYLLDLCRFHQIRLVTLDRGIAQLQLPGEVIVELVLL